MRYKMHLNIKQLISQKDVCSPLSTTLEERFVFSNKTLYNFNFLK